jgi:hypothetical protein
MKKTNTLHFYDGGLLAIFMAILMLVFTVIEIINNPFELELWDYILLMILALPLSAYFLTLSFVAALNYKVTELGVEIYKCRKLRYFLPWEKVQSIGIYSNGIVLSKVDPYTTKKLIKGSANGPELAPWVFYKHYINSACYTKKRLAQVEDSTILLLTASMSEERLKERLVKIRALWAKRIAQ